MIVRTTAAVWLAAICSMAAPSGGFCEVRMLPGADGGPTALFSGDPASDEQGPPGEEGGPRLSPQPEVGVPEAQDLRAAALNTVTEPSQSLWRRLLSAVVQLGAPAASR